MKALGNRRGIGPAVAASSHGFVAAVLASALAAGCDDTFQPFHENEDAIFSMFGVLDLKADTQWVRVMPVRQNLLLGPEPIDAVVTLEHLGSGQMVTLNDSLFRFTDPQLDGVAYVHNFWTTERLQPGTSYRLTAARGDGASSTALVVMPVDLEIALLHDHLNGRRGSALALLQVRAERVVFVEMLYAMSTLTGHPAIAIPIRDHWTFSTGVPGTRGIGLSGDTLRVPGFLDVRRQEIRLTAARDDWPYHPGLSDLTVVLPSTSPSNVEKGLGFVGGVATWRIPFDRCDVLAVRPDLEQSCTTILNGQSASIAGRVMRGPCGDPHILADIHLTERFAGGGAVIRRWKTGWDGRYRFEGIAPGADLVLELSAATPAVHLPPLAPGARYTVNEISVPVDYC
jgi:hypothetical protein